MSNIIKDLLVYPNYYAQIRLSTELEHHDIEEIKNALTFELLVYKEEPHLIDKTYKSIDHLLDYIIEVKKHSQENDKA